MSESKQRQRKIPKQLRGEATVAAIVEAAAHILERDGVEAYNTNAVAGLARISVGSLYQYFANKDDISRTLIDREASTMLRVLEGIAATGGGAPAIRDFVAAIVTHLMRRPNLARILDVLEQKLSLQDDVLRSETAVELLMQTCLSGAYERLARDPAVVRDMIGIIRGMVDGAVAKGERDIDSITARVDRAIQGYLLLSNECLG